MQHDYNLSNQTFSSFRSDLNNALLAIVSQNSGASEPSTMFAYQWWADTTTGLLKLRNAANSGWVTIGSLSLVNLGLASLSGATFTGALLAAVGTVAAPGIAFDGDPNSGIYWVSANTWEMVADGVAYARVSTAGITFLGTGATTFPSGTTAERPGSPVNGMIRYNTTTAKMDVYSNGAWGILPAVTAYPLATADVADGAITPAKKAALGQQTANGTASPGQTSSSTSYVDITSCSVSLMTTGRPVFVGLKNSVSGFVEVADASGTSAGLRIKFLRDSTIISECQFLSGHGGTTNTTFRLPASAFWCVDTGVTAGTYTYKAQVQCIASGDVATLIEVGIVAFEL